MLSLALTASSWSLASSFGQISTTTVWLLLGLVVEMGLDEAAELLINEVPVLENLFPGSDAFALMGHPFSPDVHRSFQLLQPLVSYQVSSFSDHAAPSLATLDNLLEHDEALELGSVDIVWQLGLPLLVRQLYDLLKHLIESLVLVLLDDQENVVELVLDGARVHEGLLVVGQVSPIFLLPEELNPHFVRAWGGIAHSLVVTAVKMSNISELFPFVEDF